MSTEILKRWTNNQQDKVLQRSQLKPQQNWFATTARSRISKLSIKEQKSILVIQQVQIRYPGKATRNMFYQPRSIS